VQSHCEVDADVGTIVTRTHLNGLLELLFETADACVWGFSSLEFGLARKLKFLTVWQLYGSCHRTTASLVLVTGLSDGGLIGRHPLTMFRRLVLIECYVESQC
jgi:hypothetical protein